MHAITDAVNYPLLCDTITVELHYPTPPYGLAFQTTGTIDVFGYGQLFFPDEVHMQHYYLVVRYRNALETWSKIPVIFNDPLIDFDLTK